MNDPHVQRLIYDIQHAPSTDSKKASPLKYGNVPDFTVLVDGQSAVIRSGTSTTPVPSLPRAIVEPFLRAREVSAVRCCAPARSISLPFSTCRCCGPESAAHSWRFCRSAYRETPDDRYCHGAN